MELSDLAANRRPAALPPVARRHRNGFIELLRESMRTGEAYALPPVAPDGVSRTVRALRRAAEYAGLGVRIRRTVTPCGDVMLHYQARALPGGDK